MTRTTKRTASANTQNRTISRIQRRAIVEVQRLSYAFVGSAMRAFRSHRFHPEDVTRMMNAFVPIMRDAMIASHITGVEWAVKKSPVQLSEFDDLVKQFESRKSVPVATLQNVYHSEASRMVVKSAKFSEQKLAETLAEISKKGMTNAAGAAVLEKQFNALGLTPNNSFQLECMVRTQSQLGFSAGKWQTFQRPKIRDAIWGYEYMTAGDDRVREEHEELDGMTAPASDRIWTMLWPPNGWACRCQTIPLFDPHPVNVPDSATIADAITPGFGFNPGARFAGR